MLSVNYDDIWFPNQSESFKDHVTTVRLSWSAICAITTMRVYWLSLSLDKTLSTPVKDKGFQLPDIQDLLLVTSVLASHGQPRILDAVMLLLLSKQNSTVKEGDESGGTRLLKGLKGRAERGGAQQNLDHRVLKAGTALTLQGAIRKKKIQFCPRLKNIDLLIYLLHVF